MNIANSFLSNIYQFPKVNIARNATTLPFKGFGNNLAPLTQDTVSFEGNKKTKGKKDPNDVVNNTVQSISSSDDKSVDRTERVPLKLSESIYHDSEYAFGIFKYSIHKMFNKPVIDMDSPSAKEQLSRIMSEKSNDPIIAITARRKSPESIAEKMTKTHSRSIKSAKEDINDLIGVRIIVSSDKPNPADGVIETLTDAVKKRRIKISQIKKHGQNDPKLEYVSKRKLNNFIDAARKVTPTCEYKDQPRDSGYMAIHIITDEIADGYNGEIQIMGYNVAKFKDIEDLCYKCMGGSKLPAKYEPIEKLFEPMLKDKTKTMKKQYLEYIKQAYAYERKKPMGKGGSYLHIPKEMSFIPKELDVNNIARLKNHIDRQEKKSAE